MESIVGYKYLKVVHRRSTRVKILTCIPLLAFACWKIFEMLSWNRHVDNTAGRWGSRRNSRIALVWL